MCLLGICVIRNDNRLKLWLTSGFIILFVLSKRFLQFFFFLFYYQFVLHSNCRCTENHFELGCHAFVLHVISVGLSTVKAIKFIIAFIIIVVILYFTGNRSSRQIH